MDLFNHGGVGGDAAGGVARAEAVAAAGVGAVADPLGSAGGLDFSLGGASTGIGLGVAVLGAASAPAGGASIGAVGAGAVAVTGGGDLPVEPLAASSTAVAAPGGAVAAADADPLDE